VSLLRASRASVTMRKIMAGVLLAPLLTVSLAPSAQASTACNTSTVTVERLHQQRFFTDLKDNLTSKYAGYKVSSSVARGDLWMKLSGFTGGSVTLAPTQTNALPIGTAAPAAPAHGYFYLQAAALTTSAQSHTVEVWSGNPSAGGTLLCATTSSFTSVENALGANANKVQDINGDGIAVTVSPATPALGQSFSISVEGNTGTLGDTQSIDMSPAVFPEWPAGSFRLTNSAITIARTDGGAATTSDHTLFLTGLGSTARTYTAVYTFAAIAPTSADHRISPVQYITSGQQWKHTDLGSIASIPAITPVSNTTVLSKSASPSVLPLGGGTTTFTLELTSSSPVVTNLDQLVDTPAQALTYLPGSARFNGATIANPTVSSGQLVFPGPFSVSSTNPGRLTYQMSAPAGQASHLNTAIGHIGGSVIDTTVETTDLAPASATVHVGPASQSITFPQPPSTPLSTGTIDVSATATSGLPVTLESLTPAVCTISQGTVTMLSRGTCTLRATQDGDQIWQEADPVVRSFEVTKEPQSITFLQPENLPLSAGVTTLIASASSGLPLTFVSTTPGTCSVAQAVVTLLARGTCTIQATQNGDDVFFAAAPVTRSFQITKEAQVIDFPQPANVSQGTATVTISATASSGLPVSFTSNTPGVCTVSGTTVTMVAASGTCTIRATQPGDENFFAADAVTRSFSIVDQAQTITFAQPSNVTVGATPSMSASASSGLSVRFESNTPSVCTVSGAVVTTLAGGTCSITAYQDGNATWAPASPVTRTFTVNKLNQSITFPQPSDGSPGQSQTLNATASSGLPVTYTSTTPEICTVSGSTLTFVGGGDCSITASQSGNERYNPAPNVTHEKKIKVAFVSQTITFAQPPNTPLLQGSLEVTASASSGLVVTITSSTPTICTVSGFTVTLLSAGTCTLVASQSGDAVFSPATNVTRSFSVTKIAQAITFEPPTTLLMTQSPYALVAGATSGLNVSFASTTPSICTVSASTVTLLAAGTCTVVASQPGDAYYLAAPNVSRNIAVNKIDQSITFPQPSTQTSGGSLNLDASASSGLSVTYTSLTPSVCTVSGSVVTMLTSGTCTIVANQPGNGTYNAAPSVTRSFAVDTQSQSITFPQPSDRVITSGTLTLNATATSGLAVQYVSSTTGICTVSGATVSLLQVGTCTIVASQPGNLSWSAAESVTRSFQIIKADQSITFAQPNDQVTTAGSITLGASASSGLSVTYTSLTPSVCTVSGSVVTILTSGTCMIAATQPGNGSYNAAETVTRSFTVSKAAQTITFNQPADQIVTTSSIGVSATATSGLTVSFASDTTSVCTVAGSTVSILAAGTCTLVATQPGNQTYEAAPSVTRSFQVSKLNQSITFTQPGDKSAGQSQDLSATATSSLGVTFTSATPEICSVSGSVVTAINAGTCTVVASQPGNGTYNAAPDVSRSFAISKLTQSINFPQPGNEFITTPGVDMAAEATSGLSVQYVSTTPDVCTVTGARVTLVGIGTCSIVASQPGSGAFEAATPVTRSFNVLKAPQSITFPQPADEFTTTANTSVAANATSGLPVALSTSTPGVCTVSGFTVTLVASGTCTLVATQPGNEMYAAAEDVIRSFQVRKVPQSITFPQPGQSPVGSTLSPGATSSSGLPVTYTSSTPSVCSVSGGVVVMLTGGTCTLSASQPGNGMYSSAPEVTRSFTVTKLDQSITFPRPGEQRSGDSLNLGGSASSGLPVTYTSSTPSVCSVTGSVVTLIGPGTCTLSASQPGNDIYNPAAPVTHSFNVVPSDAKLDQTITFDQPSTKTLGDGAVRPGATASSGLPVTYVSATPRICTVSGQWLILMTTGTCTVRATQPGNSTYKPAANVSRSFKIVSGAPGALTQPMHSPASATTTTSAWPTVTGATVYRVSVNGTLRCTTTKTQCVLPQLIGPKSEVIVTAVNSQGENLSTITSLFKPKRILVGVVNFDTASWSLSAAAKRTLNEISATVGREGFAGAEFDGHTDKRGSIAYNRELAGKRAKAVESYVLSRLPVSLKKVVTLGFWFSKPLQSGNDAASLAKNRRVEIYIK
jgi:large repetitive protein